MRATATPCVLRKEDPHWRFALAASPVTEGIVVMLESEAGARGYGYGSATAHMGAAQPALKAAIEAILNDVRGYEDREVESILNSQGHGKGLNQARAGVECALFDLKARELSVPLYRLLGKKRRERVPILRILSIKSPEEMAKNALTLVAAGYAHLKIKIDGNVEDDVARVRAIRRAVGRDTYLTVDANQSYGVDDAIAALSRMEEYGIALAEQPVNKDDLKGLKRVADSVAVPVEADESASSLARVEALAVTHSVDAVSLKIPKLGGLTNTLAAAAICDAHGISCRMGAAVGSRLLSAHAMHLAAVLPNHAGPAELGEFARLLDDPFQGIEIENGALRLPEGPGSGVELRETGKAAGGCKA